MVEYLVSFLDETAKSLKVTADNFVFLDLDVVFYIKVPNGTQNVASFKRQHIKAIKATPPKA